MSEISPTEQKLVDRLDEIEQSRLATQVELDRQRLIRVTQEVIETITSPEFVGKMRMVRARVDGGEDISTVAAQLLSLDSLREAGVNIPEGFRLTSRVFEDSSTGLRIEIKDKGSDPTSLRANMGGCICGGSGGFSAGAGWN